MFSFRTLKESRFTCLVGIGLLLLVSFATKMQIVLVGGDTLKYGDALGISGADILPSIYPLELPLPFWILKIAALSGFPFQSFFRILLSIFLTLTAIPTYFLAKSIYHSRSEALLCSALMVLNPSTIGYVRYGVFNNALGLPILLFGLLFLHRYFDKATHPKTNLMLFMICMLLSVGTHTLTTGLLYLVSLFFLSFRIFGRRKLKLTQSEKPLLLFLVLLGAVLMALLVPFSYRYRKMSYLFDFNPSKITERIPYGDLYYCSLVWVSLFSFYVLLANDLSREHCIMLSIAALAVATFVLSLITFSSARYRFENSMFLPYSLLMPLLIRKNSVLILIPFYAMMAYFGGIQ